MYKRIGIIGKQIFQITKNKKMAIKEIDHHFYHPQKRSTKH
jgi:hypothetical protein